MTIITHDTSLRHALKQAELISRWPREEILVAPR